MGNSTTRRPRRATASATASGSDPPPQMIASGSCVSARSWLTSSIRPSALVIAARLQQRPAGSFAHEGEDRGDGGIAAQFRLHAVDPARELALAEEQHPVSLADRAYRVARKLSAFHA